MATLQATTPEDERPGHEGDEGFELLYDVAENETTLEGALAGWAKMAKKVDHIDQSRVKRVKEDMDILLVFAGLFSSVLTTFLVESFQNLQEDNSATTVQLLRQIATQNHTYDPNTGAIKPSISSALQDPSAFSPSPSAICVNVLWFMSLIVALSTASFGILVQQWLREYLAIEYDTPQARLRIRHFRYPGLVEWKVFEIAGSLPLLLQLALALFFAGLCVFALSTHSSIGWTSIPMVSVWGTLIVLTALAPIVSSRCPYRTTLLPDMLKKFRRFLLSKPATRRMYRGPRTTGVVKYVGNGKPPDKGKDAGEGKNVGEGKNEKTAQIPLEIPLEEDEVARSSREDYQVLSSISVVHLHDEMLATTILGLLHQMQAPADAIFKFFLRVIDHRLPALRGVVDHYVSSYRKHVGLPIEMSPLFDIRRLFDMRPLSKPIWDGIARAASTVVEQYCLKDRGTFEERPDCTDHAILTLFAQSSFQRSSAVEDLRKKLLSPKNYKDTCRVLIFADFPRMWACLKHSLHSYDVTHQEEVFLEILRLRACDLNPDYDRGENANTTQRTNQDDRGSCVSRPTEQPRSKAPATGKAGSDKPELGLSDFISRYKLSSSDFEAISFLLEADITRHRAVLIERHRTGLQETDRISDAVQSLNALLKLAYSKYGAVGGLALSTIFQALGHDSSVGFWDGLKPEIALQVLQAIARYLYPEDEFKAADHVGRHLILQNLSTLLKRYASGDLDPVERNVDVLRLALRPIWVFKECGAVDGSAAEWDALWLSLAQALSKYSKLPRRTVTDQALEWRKDAVKECLDALPDIAKSPVTELREALNLILPPADNLNDSNARQRQPYLNLPPAVQAILSALRDVVLLPFDQDNESSGEDQQTTDHASQSDSDDKERPVTETTGEEASRLSARYEASDDEENRVRFCFLRRHGGRNRDTPQV